MKPKNRNYCAALACLAMVTTLAMSQTISQLTADGQNFDAYFEEFDGQEWLLIGRGREGWEFDTDGQGAVGDVSQNVGTTAAFAPKCYSDAIIIDLLSQRGDTSMANVEMRLSRASDTT
ncbi:hypothetical protein [Rubritalea profundi]|uniref:3-keto-disaccharide hydrolase domain-containing protein n=1 Tax=Rubritalea profundi TaxID=1658618 RepID=A0A2S7TZA5_9BACT|nr:hypothetical protein [Rubritalea profundi]PQJ27587.1 hypothetical protein BSZ32_03150 [Rubritalea profundi]